MTDPISDGGKPAGEAPVTGDPLSATPSGAKSYGSLDEALNDLKIDESQKKILQDLGFKERSKAVTEAQKEWGKKAIPVEEADRRADEKANRIVEAKLKERDLISERHRILREQFSIETHKDGATTEQFKQVGAKLKAFAQKYGMDYDMAVSTPEGFRSLCLSAGLRMKSTMASDDDIIDAGDVFSPSGQPAGGKKVAEMTPEERYHAAASGKIPWPK